MQYYDRNGYYLGNIDRLGFVPNAVLKLENNWGKATLLPTMRYELVKTNRCVGEENGYYIIADRLIFYKSPSFCKENGAIIEHWGNQDATFDSRGYLISFQ